MPQMTEDTLKALLASQHASAMAAQNASKLSAERADALAYYNGDVSKDLPVQPGQSSAVSMDVSDTVEGMMPQLMEIFAGTDEVVKFEPVGPEDVQAAEQETDYVNHVFMNQNPGFMVLYSFIKDALLSKVGVVKVWWEKKDKEERETYLDKTPDEYALIVATPEIEVIEQTEHDGLYDVTIARKKTYAQARVEAVPPEEFGIEAGARNIRDCNYCFHKIVTRTEADLIEQGYDEAQVKALPSYRAWMNTEETSRDTVDENSSGNAAAETNTASRLVEITEHYSRIDYKGDGRTCLYKITTGGQKGEILRLNGELDVVEFDAIPFAAMTPVIVTHRFYGKSLADLVMDIMRIKTALLRALLNNMYLANNRRIEVSESHVTDNTIDDLLVSRPGGLVRVKAPGGLRELDHTDIGSHVYPAIEYLDATREWRTGVTKQGQGIDANALQNQSATAVNQAFTASQARVRLIARIFAETGIKDLFWLLHGVIKKHGQQASTVRLRNQWVTVDPRNWKSRDDLTVSVGLGTGSKEAQLAMIQMLIGAQEKGISAGLVSKRNLWNSAQELVKLTGRKDPEAFFTNPAKPPDEQDPASAPIEPPPDPRAAEAQAKLQLEGAKAQQGMQIEQAKLQASTQNETAKLQIMAETEQAKMVQDAQIKREQMAAEFQLRREQMTAEFALKREQMMIEAEIKREANRMNASVKAEAAKSDGITDTKMGGEVG